MTKIFSRLYDKALTWSVHRHAPYYLSGLSFAESSVFPIPPDVMLIPMSLAHRNKALYYAWLTTIFSVLGGILGYFIGYFAIELVEPFLHKIGWYDNYLLIKDKFTDYGFWYVFVAGFTPIPYKIFTIAAGTMSMDLLLFVLASFIGRGARFYLVAGGIMLGGERLEKALRKYIDKLTWVVLIAAVVLYFYLKS